jgi:transcription elongation factor GreA
MQRYPMTAKGAEELRHELDRLKRIERPAVINAIAEARAHGDLKENAEYHAAREKQSFLEGRIQDLEGKLSLVEIIDISKVPNEGKVIFGSTITLINGDTDEEVTYQIVGEEEANLEKRKISYNTPIARALIGKHEGDTVTIKIPSGNIEYEIVKVVYL